MSTLTREPVVLPPGPPPPPAVPPALDQQPSGRPPARKASLRDQVATLLLACRPHQWIKNVLIALAPAAAGVLLNPVILQQTVLAMVAFTVAAGATYLVNDLADMEADRLHPTKRHRPIASGRLSRTSAARAAAILASIAIIAAVDLGLGFFVVLAGYLLLTTAYSHWLKKIPVVDVIAVATGFVLRVVAGAMATHTALPMAVLLAVGAGAVMILVGKRDGEIAHLGEDAAQHRRVLDWYTPRRVATMLVAAESVAIITGGAWLVATVGPAFAALGTGAALLVLERYRRLVAGGRVDDPVRLLIHDRAIGSACLILLVVLGVGVH